MEIKKIVINKNRGWRGLAELRCINSEREEVIKMIFSFSQPVWDDMQDGIIVTQTEQEYIIINFDNTEALPKGQRSVLLKYFTANVLDVDIIPKSEYGKLSFHTTSRISNAIRHFIRNTNNHTTSDWNCVGIRVIPEV